MFVRFPSASHSTCAIAWLGLDIGRRMDLCCVWITHHTKQELR